MTRITLAVACLSILLAASPAMAEHKVLAVSLDGCRPDALQIANTPHVDALIAAGAASFDARNVLDYGDSGPNYSSMLTGVNWPKHGVTDNTFAGSHFDLWPHMFKRIEALDPGAMYTAQFCGWGPINAGTEADHYADQVGALGDSGNAAAIVTLLQAGDPDVIFWQISAPDSAGHSNGFSPTVPGYITAIEQADTLYGNVLDALYGRPGYIDGSEEWLILTVTDHGGHSTSHHLPDASLTEAERLEIQKTFYVATGPGVGVGADLGQPRVYDVAVTALEYMGVATQGLDLDGRVVMPEPATLGLLALGGLGLLLRRSRT
jgi:predicted AlkP superfamily pyrophosphatase or phosphodiesterase